MAKQNEYGHVLDVKPNAPFPTGGADGSSPVHKAGMCCHQTLQAECKNSHKYTHINVAVHTYLSARFFLQTHTNSDTHARLSVQHLLNAEA